MDCIINIINVLVNNRFILVPFLLERPIFCLQLNYPIVHMNYIIEGEGALVNEKGEETPLKAGDFALVNPSEKHQYRNKGDKPFKMICGVPKEFE